MKKYLLLLLGLTVFLSCDNAQQSEDSAEATEETQAPMDDAADLIAILQTDEHTLYVKAGFMYIVNSLLESNQMGDNTFEITAYNSNGEEFGLRYEGYQTDDLTNFLANATSSPERPLYKFYQNRVCKLISEGKIVKQCADVEEGEPGMKKTVILRDKYKCIAGQGYCYELQLYTQSTQFFDDKDCSNEIEVKYEAADMCVY